MCRAAQRSAYSIPVVFLLTAKYRVVQLLQNREVRAGSSPKLRLTLTLATSFGFLVQHVEVLLAWRTSSRKKNLERQRKRERKRNETNCSKSSPCTRIKEPGQSTLLFIFVTSNLPATIRYKNKKPQNYDECSQKGESGC